MLSQEDLLEEAIARPANQPVMTNSFSFRTVAAKEPQPAVTLATFILGARSACEQWGKGEKAAARAMAGQTAALLQSEADALDDAPPRAEAELARKLAALMVP